MTQWMEKPRLAIHDYIIYSSEKVGFGSQSPIWVQAKLIESCRAEKRRMNGEKQ